MLDKDTLKTDIKGVLTEVDQYNKTTNATAEESMNKFAELLANAIEKYVKSGQIKFAAQEIAVATSGTATSQTGGNTSPITKNLE